MSSSGSTKAPGTAVVSTRRKMEVLGLVLMVLALLLSLAFITYQPGDDAVAYLGVSRSTLAKNREPQCVPGWMPAVMAYVGFEIADSGVKR